MFEKLLAFGKNEKQIRQEVEVLSKLIFPHGEGHKQRIETLLYEIDGKKLDKTSLMISFIEGKQQYLKNQSLADVYNVIQKSPARFRNEQIRNIVALIVLDAKSEKIDALPEIARIKEYAQTLEI